MDIANLLSKLAAKAGQELPQDLVKAAEAVQFTVPEDVAGKLFDGVFSAQEAKNSKDVKSHYFKQFADGVEAELSKGKTLLGDDAFAEVMKQDTLFKKVSAFAAKSAEVIETAKSGQANPDEVKKYIDQVNALNKTLASKEDEYKAQLTGVHADYQKKFVDKELTTKLIGYKFNEAIPEEYRLKLAKEAVYDGLKTAGADVVLKGDSLSLVQAADANLEFTAQKLEDIVQKSLIEKKLVTTAPAQSQRSAQGTTGRPANQPGFEFPGQAKPITGEQPRSNKLVSGFAEKAAARAAELAAKNQS